MGCRSSCFLLSYGSRALVTLWIAIAGIVFQSCGGAHMPLPPLDSDLNSSNAVSGASANPKSSGIKKAAVTFQEVKPIFRRACNACHAPGGSLPSWTDYATAYRLRARIFDRVVVKKNMPMGATLPASDINLIAQWVQSGALESHTGDASPPSSDADQAEPELSPRDATSPVAPPPAEEPSAPSVSRCEDQAPVYQGGTPELSGTVNEHYARGHAGYVKYSCATCHGASGRGDGPAAVAYDPRPRNFWSEEFKRGSRPAEILATISTGFCSMPGFEAAIPEVERMEIATFLAGLRQKDPEAERLFEPPAKSPQPEPKTKKSKPGRPTPTKKKTR